MKTLGKLTGFHKFLMFVLCLFVFAVFSISSTQAAEWKAGKAAVVITPEEPVWMGGYGGRTKPFEGKTHDLYVKALAIDDPEGNRVVIVTADILGFTIDFSNSVYKEINKRFGLPREALLFNTTHTHCGPAVPLFKISLYDMPEEEEEKIDTYMKWLKLRYIQVISEAISDLKPAVLSFSSGTPTPFAVCRRFPTPEGIVYRSGPSSYYTGGPRDDIVPVLKIADTAGQRQAIRFGKITKRQAETAKLHIEDLLTSLTAGTSPKPATAQWLQELPEIIRVRLERTGLAGTRNRQQCPTLAEFMETYMPGDQMSKVQQRSFTDTHKGICWTTLAGQSDWMKSHPVMQMVSGMH